MYKSRVETFNRVLDFHHLIFSLFILQDDDVNKQTAVLHSCSETEAQTVGKEARAASQSVVEINAVSAGTALALHLVSS